MTTPEQLQREYYARTAGAYDAAHADGHFGGDWLPTFASLLAAEGVASVLDVGCATGTRTAALAEGGLRVTGLDPVAELLATAGRRPGTVFVRGSAYALPFRSASFDAVLEMGALHHVRSPGRAVREMTRVARRVVILADANRFGQGPLPVRLAKLLLCKARLWPAVEAVRTRGRGYHVSEGDGVFYSYSVFDSLPELAGWADRVFPLSLYPPSPLGLLHPLLTSPSVALVAFRSAPMSAPGEAPGG